MRLILRLELLVYFVFLLITSLDTQYIICIIFLMSCAQAYYHGSCYNNSVAELI